MASRNLGGFDWSFEDDGATLELDHVRDQHVVVEETESRKSGKLEPK